MTSINVAIYKSVRHEEALKSLKWKELKEEEMSMIQKSKTSELADKHKGKKVTRVKWVYKIKLNADNSIKKIQV
jgi:hypothetical protein